MFAAPSTPGSPIPKKSAFSKLAPGESVEKLLDPPPPSFCRRPPALPCAAFMPMSTFCKGSTLNNGFPEMAPPATAVPHPFVVYDVTEEDWKWFLYTVKISASLSPMNRVVAGAVPMILGLGIFGVVVAPVIEHTIKKHKTAAVADLIDHWNAYFFNPRHLNVVLARGTASFSGSFDTPSDLAQYTADDASQTVFEGSLAGEEESNESKKARQRQAEKAGRKRRKKRDDTWRLVIAFKT
ncbi:hypothetical protein C8Q72DRAFT_199240 [Fomitopsis betulina]|nr:hypothetical protein C8Q72DRAFT_199240 [Fomitopsis betulina]